MSRGLPYSVALHLMALILIVVYGAYVPPPPLQQQQLIRVHLRELPEPAAATPEPVQVQVEPVAEPEPAPPPEPEPQKVPEKQPEKTRVKPEPEAAPQRVAEKPARSSESAPAEVTAPPGQEAAVSGTDEPFPFAWYLEIIRGRIARQWNPPQVGMRDVAERACAVHFFVERGGAVTRATIVRSSGIALLDRAGLRAVQAAHPLPPLPREFASGALGVTFVFHLKSGM
jgi:protein TonB